MSNTSSYQKLKNKVAFLRREIDMLEKSCEELALRPNTINSKAIRAYYQERERLLNDAKDITKNES